MSMTSIQKGSSLSLYLIVGGTLITGAANSLLTKYQDNQCVKNCSSIDDPTTRKNFEQPAIQTLQMFLGEFAMFFVWLSVRYYDAKKAINQQSIAYEQQANLDSHGVFAANEEGSEGVTNKEVPNAVGLFQNWRLAIPAICDLSCTTLLNIGLVYTPVSIYQMTRGSIVLFVAVLSVIFLKRKITKLQWLSLAFVTLGVAIVGLSGSQHGEAKNVGGISDEAATSAAAAAGAGAGGGAGGGLVLLGIALIIFATSFQGIQFVVEEHILAKHPVIPLQLVYIEGFFGASTIMFFMVLFNYIFSYLQTPEEFADSPFNMIEAFAQVFTNKTVLVSSVLIMISIASFNYCGLSITHRVSATARSTVDTCRTLIVWLVAIVMGWEQFLFLQMLGFVVLVFGTLCFNGVLKPEEWKYVPKWLKEEQSVVREERRALIEEFEEFEDRT